MIKLEALKYLLGVAQYNSINTVAEKNFISKSTVSTTIKKLEEDLGIPLMTRNYRGVSLTAAGREVATKANEIFSLLDAVEKISLQTPILEKKSPLYIYATPYCSAVFMPDYFKSISNLSDRLLFYSVDQDTLLYAINKSCENFGIVLEDDAFEEKVFAYPNLLCHKLATSELYTITAKNTSFLNSKSISLKQLKNVPLILYSDFEQDDTLLSLISSYLTPDIRLRTNDANIYYQAIINDYGVGFHVKTRTGFGLGSQQELEFVSLHEKLSYYFYFLSNQNASAETQQYLADIFLKML